MKEEKISFDGQQCSFFWNAEWPEVQKFLSDERTIIITDAHVAKAHEEKLKPFKTIVIKAGEDFKTQQTADLIITELIQYEVDRSWSIVGMGGGVVTDITGYVASIYMRGIKFGFIPSSLLCMVDAGIGGKNGVDRPPYKNLIGTIRQPSFIFYCFELLKTLPQAEWNNGFAEIIKHASILDSSMFRKLERLSVEEFQGDNKKVMNLIKRNAMLKAAVVKKDVHEKGDRKLLNFGHTIGHALEMQYELSHGEAISIGMSLACEFSEKLKGFKKGDRVRALLEKYRLPVVTSFDSQKVFDLLKMDKKRSGEFIQFILLEKIGKAVIHPISFKDLGEMML